MGLVPREEEDFSPATVSKLEVMHRRLQLRSFAEAGLHPSLINHVHHIGYDTILPAQIAAITAERDGFSLTIAGPHGESSFQYYEWGGRE